MAGLSYDQVMNLWVQAGGSPQSAAMAAAVADASSGLNPDAQNTGSSGLISKGLFQIPSTQGALSTLDPTANTRAAIQLSNGGTDFSKWCSTWSDNDCGNSGGSYLGPGANALASLAQRGGQYNVVGGVGITSALPQTILNKQTGQPATAADLPGATPDGSAPATALATGSTSRTLVMLLLLVVVAVALYITTKKDRGKKPDGGESSGE